MKSKIEIEKEVWKRKRKRRLQKEIRNRISVLYFLSIAIVCSLFVYHLRLNVYDGAMPLTTPYVELSSKPLENINEKSENNFRVLDVVYVYIDSETLEKDNDFEASVDDMSGEQTELAADESEIELLAKLIYGEARGLTEAEQAAVAWCVFNRVDNPLWPNSVSEVILQSNPCIQFEGYSASNPVEESIAEIARSAWTAWKNEDESQRTLPQELTFFHAECINGRMTNVFTTSWDGGGRFVFE